MNEKQRRLHNELAGEIVKSIVRPPLEAGGSTTDVLILLESVITGVYAACVRLGGDPPVWSVMSQAIEERLAEMRLTDLPTAGQS
jgi:hypothetical protein